MVFREQPERRERTGTGVVGRGRHSLTASWHFPLPVIMGWRPQEGRRAGEQKAADSPAEAAAGGDGERLLSIPLEGQVSVPCRWTG